MTAPHPSNEFLSDLVDHVAHQQPHRRRLSLPVAKRLAIAGFYWHSDGDGLPAVVAMMWNEDVATVRAAILEFNATAGKPTAPGCGCHHGQSRGLQHRQGGPAGGCPDGLWPQGEGQKRTALAAFTGRGALELTAKVGRYSSRPGRRGTPQATVLLLNIQQEGSGHLLADHVWLDAGQWSRELRPGDRFACRAKVEEYRKTDPSGLRVTDLSLARPTHVRRVDDADNRRFSPQERVFGGSKALA